LEDFGFSGFIQSPSLARVSVRACSHAYSANAQWWEIFIYRRHRIAWL